MRPATARMLPDAATAKSCPSSAGPMGGLITPSGSRSSAAQTRAVLSSDTVATAPPGNTAMRLTTDWCTPVSTCK